MSLARLRLPFAAASSTARLELALPSEREPAEPLALATVATRLEARPVLLVLPVLRLLVTQVQIPARRSAVAARALPWALEEHLLAPANSDHILLGPQTPAGWTALAVAREWLDPWLAELARSGIQVAHWVPEQWLLPWQEGEWSLLVEGETCLLRHAVTLGLRLDLDALEGVLAAQAEPAPGIHLLGRMRETQPVAARLRALGRVVRTGPDRSPWALLVDTPLPAAPGWRLELPASATVSAAGPERARPLWRLGLASLAVVLAFAANQVESLRLESAIAARQAESASLLLQAFPDIRRVVDAETQMRQGLADLQRSSGLLGLLGSVAPVIAAASPPRLEACEYSEAGLMLEVSGDSLLQLDGLTQRLAATPGQDVRLEDVSRSADAVRGRIRLTPRS
jgi:general secretion pathway protein L